MKTFKNVLILCAFLFTAGAIAQENYTVNGNTYSLKTEVEGPLTLLWNVIDNEYRYFAKKGNTIVELKNTRVDGKYQEEYKQTLTELTSDNPVDASKTNLTLVSLRGYVNSYNKKADPAYQEKSTSVDLSTRLGVFAGMSNNNATTNPENVFAPLAGIEFEVTDNVVLRRHSIVLQFRHSFEAEDYDLTFSQFALNYRFKFIHTDQLSVFAQAKMVTLTFSKLAEDNVEGLEELSNTSVNTPIGLGLGLDYKIGNGFFTFGLNDLVSPGVDTNGEFSVDVTLGYKFSL
tara:strand:+ start:11449 stop:12312 length:864 start_codon:yes stop_codon:yes gene_type:complete